MIVPLKRHNTALDEKIYLLINKHIKDCQGICDTRLFYSIDIILSSQSQGSIQQTLTINKLNLIRYHKFYLNRDCYLMLKYFVSGIDNSQDM